MKNKLIIVAGCSGSGKSTVSKTILENFNPGDAQIICLDRFYKKTKNEMPKVRKNGPVNYDHPDAFDWSLLYKCLTNLLNNRVTTLPVYDYQIQTRLKEGEVFKPSKVIILEGILPLYDKRVNDLASLKVYVDTPLDECFIRRLLRDQGERGRSINSIVKQWQEAVRPMYNAYVEPLKNLADLILPWDRININGLEFLTTAIKETFKSK